MIFKTFIAAFTQISQVHVWADKVRVGVDKVCVYLVLHCEKKIK